MVGFPDKLLTVRQKPAGANRRAGPCGASPFVTRLLRLFDQLAAGTDHRQLNKLRAGMVVGAEGDAIAAEVLVHPLQVEISFPVQFLATFADRLDSQLGDDETSMLV